MTASAREPAGTSAPSDRPLVPAATLKLAPGLASLLDEVSDLSWMDFAACGEVGGDEWFPEKGGSSREAKKVCRRCEVRPECLRYALEHDERFGIWGGTSERERRRLKHSRGREAA